MKKILFVCLGNICRSPMAEYIFKDLVKKNNLSSNYVISSAGTSREEEGNDMHYGAKDKLIQKGISFSKHRARQLKKEDYNEYDYIIAMEESNVRGILRIVGSDSENKIHRLLDYSENPRDIADPWYTGNFEVTYNDITEGCMALLNYLEKDNRK